MSLGVNDGNMEEGSLRCDANVSVRPAGQTAFGTKAEVKNLNSFRFLQKAIEFEIERQIDLLAGGGTRACRKRGCGIADRTNAAMRSKEEAHDYRYFPEPDLPPLVVTRRGSSASGRSMPETAGRAPAPVRGRLRLARVRRRRADPSPELADYFEARGRGAAGSPKAASNWVMGELLRTLNDRGLDVAAAPVRPRSAGRADRLVEQGTISGSIAKDVFEKMFDTGRAADEIVAAEGLAQISDEDAVLAIVRRSSPSTPMPVARVPRRQAADVRVPGRPGDEGSGGKANPPLVNRVLTRELTPV